MSNIIDATLILCCITFIVMVYVFAWSLCKVAARTEEMLDQEARDWEERNC